MLPYVATRIQKLCIRRATAINGILEARACGAYSDAKVWNGWPRRVRCHGEGLSPTGVEFSYLSLAGALVGYAKKPLLPPIVKLLASRIEPNVQRPRFQSNGGKNPEACVPLYGQKKWARTVSVVVILVAIATDLLKTRD